MTSLYGLDPTVKLKAKMVEISEKWGDQKSLAVLYLLDWKNYQKRA
jgi:3-methyladenine DNA glycosylase/8-oxoguanine DNA glycosylase